MAPVYPPIMLGTVLDVDDILITPAGGVRQGVFVECPTIAAGRRMGPLLSSVPGLVAGDSVIVATVGYARDNIQIIGRTESRFPGVDDIPDLRGELDGRLRIERGQEIDEALDLHAQSLAGQADQLALHDRVLDRRAADADALRRSVADVRRAVAVNGSAIATNTSALAAMRTQMFGGPDRTRAPRAYVYWTADSGNLAAATNLQMTGGWAKDGADPDNMINLGNGTNANPVQITAPVAGDYELDWHAISTATSGVLYLRLLLNPVLSSTVANQVSNSSAVNQAAGGTPEATFGHVKTRRTLAANDFIIGSMYSTVAFVLKAGWFGQLRQTWFGMRYVGPPTT